MELNISIIRNETPKAKPTDESTLGFGKLFTDHMFIVEYDEGMGWHDARIQPYGPLPIDPASPVLHYAQEIFEGLKVYRRADGGLQMFRPLENANRMNQSAERLCMPTLDAEFQVQAMKALVEVEKDWVPKRDGTSLYLRPTMIASGAELGVHPARKYLYFIICSPAGSYYKNGMAPVKIHIEDHYVRAVKGGIGYAKTGGNYAASLKAAAEAGKKGFDQVLWLDGRENKYVEEVGAMNMVFVMDGKLVTAPIGGSILPGITRKSVLQLAKEKGMEVEERPISVDELFEAHAAGKLTEAFGTGTAAVISPVGLLEYRGREMPLSEGKIGPVAQDIYDTLVGIQRGERPDPYGWIDKIS
ncbi:MAG: branched-chain amino acid aminotransferase [Oscillospiraceae bacterium]|nr:branched-chain amino acid aminotransferase [Oscillospiraceae bacterium]